MSKKTEIVDAAEEAENNINSDETAIVVENPSNSILASMMQAESNLPVENKRVVLPRMTVYMPGKKHTDKGASHGYVIDYNDGERVEVNITNLRLYRLDAHISQRIMWPFDSNTGKRLQDTSDPWCASSNGVSARKSPLFNYIGKSYEDWRNHQQVRIEPDNCAKCPFGQWVPVLDKDGNQILEDDGRGTLRVKNAGPPCAETPTWIFFDVDRKTFLVYQANNFTARMHTLGARRSRWGFIKGINAYYDTNGGTKIPDVFDKDGTLYPLNFGVKQVSNPPYGFTPVPVFMRADTPFTPDEMQMIQKAIQEYSSLKIRELVSGELFSNYAEDEMSAPAETSDAPF